MRNRDPGFSNKDSPRPVVIDNRVYDDDGDYLLTDRPTRSRSRTRIRTQEDSLLAKDEEDGKSTKGPADEGSEKTKKEKGRPQYEKIRGELTDLEMEERELRGEGARTRSLEAEVEELVKRRAKRRAKREKVKEALEAYSSLEEQIWEEGDSAAETLKEAAEERQRGRRDLMRREKRHRIKGQRNTKK